MKKLIAALALTAMAQSALAEGADFSHDAEFRFRYQVDQEQDFDADTRPSSTNSWDQRVKWGTTFRAGEKLSGHLTLMHNMQWGANGGAKIGNPDTFSANNALLVNEAYANWQATDDLMVRAGRGSFKLADGSVIDNNDYANTMTAFEGMMFVHDSDFGKSSFFGVKAAELGAFAAPDSADDPEVIMWGLAYDFKTLPDVIKMANVHVITSNKNATTTGDTTESAMRYGLTVGGDVAGFDFNVNYATHSGENVTAGPASATTDTGGNMMDVKVGYSLPDVMNLRVFGGYHMDTGNDDDATNGTEEYDNFYYDFHNNAGLMDVLRWGNLTYMNVGFSVDPMDQLSVGFHYHMFTASEKSTATFTNTVNTYSGTSNLIADKDDVGSEMNLVVDKKYSDNMSMRLRYSTFSVGDALMADADDWTQIFVEGKLTF